MSVSESFSCLFPGLCIQIQYFYLKAHKAPDAQKLRRKKLTLEEQTLKKNLQKIYPLDGCLFGFIISKKETFIYFLFVLV